MKNYALFTFIYLLKFGLAFETEVVVLRAVRNRDARLPCGQGKVFLDGPDAYVLWLKNDTHFLYRFPNEESEKRGSRDRILGTSCDTNDCHDDTSLLLKRVNDLDAGIYRCRVHYQASPSIDYVIDVRLVDSPGIPRIYNKDGEEIKRSYVGPLSLGSNLSLICKVDDDEPDTLVFWRRNGVVMERAQWGGGGRAEVRVRNATRDELDAHYECLAQNADVTEPLRASVLFKMYLPPLTVEIRVNNNYDFEAGQPRVVDCVVVGCVPPPAVTWHLGGTLLRPNVHKELHDGNYTVSSLTLAPSLRDSKQELLCRAHNSYLPDHLFQDKITLNVGYRPSCVTSREETVGAVNQEAETVTCTVDASPEPMQFSWTFADTRTLYTSVKKVAGHHNRYSSTLTWLSRDGDIGLLHCRATNSFGEQKRPCTYNVSPGGSPETPECVMMRSYPRGLKMQCQKGWDGGRPQMVHLEVLAEDGTVVHNSSNSAGYFHLPHLEEGRNLSALVYATSARGRSPSKAMLVLSARPLSASAVTEVMGSHSWSWWLEIAAGVLAIAIVVIASAYCVRVIKNRKEVMEHNPDLVPRSDGSFHREPDFTREDRLVGTTNITVNQLASCPNQYSTSPVPSCRVLVTSPGGSRQQQDASCAPSQHSYYV